MPFHGHINSNSLPYQFVIPDATADQPGVVTLDEVRAAVLSASPSTFGNEVDTTPGGAESFVGINLVAGTEVQADGRTVAVATTFRQLVASLGVGAYVAPAPVFRIQVYQSVNGGLSWDAVAGATLDIDLATSNRGSTTFDEPVVLPADSLHFLGVKQLSGGGGFSNLVFSATLS